jgi:regulator of sigma E protease
MDGLVMAGQLLLGLSILIVLHELGHFWAARAFGIKVEKFYLFFDAWGFKLFSFNYKGCEYGIGWLPLGGYVKIAGMIDESMDTEQLQGPPQPWEFRSKPAWQRLIVMLGGVTVNIILGIFIFWILTFKYGESYIPNDKLAYGVAPGIVGKSIGLQPGDQITEINGKPIARFDEINSSKVLLGNTQLTINRDGQSKTIQVPADILEKVSDHGMGQFVEPRTILGKVSQVPEGNAKKAGVMEGDSILAVNNQQIRFFDQFQQVVMANKGKSVELDLLRNGKSISLNVAVTPEGTIGVALPRLGVPTESEKYGLLEALPVGASKAWGSFTDNAKGLGKVVTGQVKANKAFTGPVGIANMFGAEVNWIKFWGLVGLLSMALALMNLLPIPALDGGHAMFLVIEMIKGKPLGDKFMEKAQLVGFVILVALMVFVLGNDIVKYVIK